MTQVIVCWATDAESLTMGNINVLSYSTGKPRVYDANKVDSRAGNPPLVRSWTTARRLMLATIGPDGAVQVPVKIAAAVGLLAVSHAIGSDACTACGCRIQAHTQRGGAVCTGCGQASSMDDEV